MAGIIKIEGSHVSCYYTWLVNQQTINSLNQINQRFYETVATAFDQTRSHPWDGWLDIPSLITEHFSESKQIKLADIGCGNARLGEFLSLKLPDYTIDYLGIDSSKELLNFAEQKLSNCPNLIVTLQKSDIISSQQIGELVPASFDCITIFGVLHHIPLFAARKKLLTTAIQSLKPGGLLLLSIWEFDRSGLFKRKLVNEQIKELGIEIAELEKNDYFLDWQRGQSAIRFCHLIDKTEVSQLLANQPIKIIKDFTADISNRYVFLQKTAT